MFELAGWSQCPHSVSSSAATNPEPKQKSEKKKPSSALQRSWLGLAWLGLGCGRRGFFGSAARELCVCVCFEARRAAVDRGRAEPHNNIISCCIFIAVVAAWYGVVCEERSAFQLVYACVRVCVCVCVCVCASERIRRAIPKVCALRSRAWLTCLAQSSRRKKRAAKPTDGLSSQCSVLAALHCVV